MGDRIESQPGLSEESEQPDSILETSKLEEELSPEVIQEIMEKVQDIHKEGTAYTRIVGYQSPENLNFESLLRHGNLSYWYGRMPENWDKRFRDWTTGKLKDEFNFNYGQYQVGGGHQSIRTDKIYFNIVGRETPITYNQYPYPLKRGVGEAYEKLDYGLILDISKLQEVAPLNWPEDVGKKLKLNEFAVDNMGNFFGRADLRGKEEMYVESWRDIFGDILPGDPKVKEHSRYKELIEKGILNEKGYPLVSISGGFLNQFRFSPKFFKGFVVIDFEKEFGQKKWEEIQAEYKKNNWPRDYLPQGEVVKKIIASEFKVKKEKPKSNALLPIYSPDGNLLWPQQMSHEEVLKFVADRDKKEE